MKSQESIKIELCALETDLELMKTYLMFQYGRNDFHGVMDAAADIREILKEMNTLKEILDVNE